jgi:hypothetical protein
VIVGELVFSRDVFAHYLLVLPIREPGQQTSRRSQRLFYRECVPSYRSHWKLIDGFSCRDILAILFASIARSENRSNKFKEPTEGIFRIDPIQDDYCDSGLLEGRFPHAITRLSHQRTLSSTFNLSWPPSGSPSSLLLFSVVIQDEP